MTPTISGQTVTLRENFKMCYPPILRKPMILSEIIADKAEVLCDDGEMRRISISHIVVES